MQYKSKHDGKKYGIENNTRHNDKSCNNIYISLQLIWQQELCVMINGLYTGTI